MMRLSRLDMLCFTARVGKFGALARGAPILWLHEHGLVSVQPDNSFVITDLGRDQLKLHGICPRCGGFDTYRTEEGWTNCPEHASGLGKR